MARTIRKKLNLFGRVFLAILALANITKASSGRLDIINSIESPYTSQDAKIIHKLGVSEGVSEDYDIKKDRIYGAMFNPSGISAKIVSIIPGYELMWDLRPEDSTTPVNLELAIHKEGANRGDPVTIDSENELWFSLPIAGAPYFYDFGKEPITLWERNIIDPNESPNDPNNYTLSFMADVRDANDKQGGTAIIPLDNLNGTYGSEIPYMYAQVRFNTFPGNFDLHSRVDMQNFAFLSEDWGKTDVNSIADISGPNGIPDKNVDFYDLSLFTRDYLKDPNDPNTW